MLWRIFCQFVHYVCYQKKVLTVSQQCNLYQQNKHSTVTLTHWTQRKNTKTYDIGKPGHGLGQAQKNGRGNMCMYVYVDSYFLITS